MESLENVKNRFLENYVMMSENTILKYKNDVELFLDACKIYTLNDLQNFNSNNLNNFYKTIKEKGWSINTATQRFKNFKNIFIKWCVQENIIKENYLSQVKLQLAKENNFVHYTPPKEDVLKILDTIKSHTKKKRLYLMVELLFSSGFRRESLCSIKIEDLDIENNIIIIKCKGNKTIEQPIPQELMLKLIDYINTERKDIIDNYIKLGGVEQGYLFLSGIGENCNPQKKNLENGNQICINSFYQQLKGYALKSGIVNADKITPHSIRRSAGTSMYEETHDTKMVQEFLGHSNISTTIKSYISYNRKALLTPTINNIFNKNKKENIQEKRSEAEYEEYLKLKEKYENMPKISKIA